MDRREYEAMARLESTLWWYRALHDKVIGALKGQLDANGTFALLDAGCGTGGLLRELRLAFPNATLSGIDISEHAVRLARTVTDAEITRGSVASMPYAAASFDVITSMDVMYHRDVDPQRMLDECVRVLRPGGTIVLNLPAYEWLRSYHDDHVATARRYTIGSLERLLAPYPLRKRYATYWNAALFVPLLIRRKLMPAKGGSDVADIPHWLNAALYAVARPENLLVRKRLRIPFGSSVFAIYERC
jgi:SAM-dependent methyltransferase